MHTFSRTNGLNVQPLLESLSFESLSLTQSPVSKSAEQLWRMSGGAITLNLPRRGGSLPIAAHAPKSSQQNRSKWALF